MYNALVIIQYASILLLLIEAVYIYIKPKTIAQQCLLLAVVATLVNNTGYLIEMQAVNAEGYIAGLKMSYFGRVWIPFALFAFSMCLCKVRINKFFYIFMATIHAITYVLVFTLKWNKIYYSSYEYIEAWPFDVVIFEHGFWYKAYTVILFIYIILGLTILFRSYFKEKDPVAKKRLLFVNIAMVMNSAFYIAGIFNPLGSYDLTVLGYAVATLFMYIAIFKYDLIDMMQLARDYVMDEVSEAIIAVDGEKNIEYRNKLAEYLFPEVKAGSNLFLSRIDDAIENKVPLEIWERFYIPEKKELYHKGYKKGELIVLKDETDHYIYTEELKKQKTIAEEANNSKSAFLSVVSHEIRTPMNAVVGMTELLLKESEKLDDNQKKYLNNIRTSGESLVMIVNDILDQSKIEAGKMEIINQPYDIRAVFEDVKLIIENRIGSKNIELINDINEKVPKYLVGDGLRIRQILINLMNNAVKFTEEGYIKLTITPDSQNSLDTGDDKINLRFSVSDTGQGIKKEDLDKLGQAFSQVDTKRNHNKEGTGLGLNISKNFISLMGGQLLVESEYGKGTEFYFVISQGISQSLENKEDVVKKEERDYVYPEARILVVDDTKLNQMVLSELLKTYEVKVDAVDSGAKAIDAVMNEKYHVIFMDYMMPYMDGVEATRQIRKLADTSIEKADYYRNVPIITLSGDTSEETNKEFFDAGVNDFSEKPVNINHIKKLLDKWIPEEMHVEKDKA